MRTEGRNDSMTLRISGKDFDIGEALRTTVQTRIQSAMAKFFDGSFSGHVTFERDGSGYRVECALHLSSGTNLQTISLITPPGAIVIGWAFGGEKLSVWSLLGAALVLLGVWMIFRRLDEPRRAEAVAAASRA